MRHATSARSWLWALRGLAVAGGARGLGFFPADWPADVAPGIAAVSREVSALSAALLSPDAPVSATGPVIAAARALHGAFYVIAVNPTREAVHTTIHARGLAGRAASVVGEGRTVAAAGDSLHDDFAPLAVHLYVAAPAPG